MKNKMSIIEVKFIQSKFVNKNSKIHAQFDQNRPAYSIEGSYEAWW
jgi:hypothetical protein